MGFEDITEQLKFMDDMVDELPSDVLKHQEIVYNHLFEEEEYCEFPEVEKAKKKEEDLQELYDHMIEERRKEIHIEEQLEMLEKALSNAVENEYYEAAAKIHKRMLELEAK